MKYHAPYGEPTGYTFEWANYQAMPTFENNLIAFAELRNNPWNDAYNIFEVIHDNRCETYHSIEDNLAFRKLGEMFLDKALYDDFILHMEQAIAAVWKTYARLAELDPVSLSNEELYAEYDRAQKDWREVIGYFRATQIDGMFPLVSTLEKIVPNSVESSLLMRSPKLDPAEQEAVDWKSLLAQDRTDEILLSHARTYPWLVGAHFTYADVLATLSSKFDFDKAHPKELHITEEKTALAEGQRTLITKYPDAQSVSESIQRFALSRMEVKAAFAGQDFYSIPIMHEIAKRTGEPVRDLNLYYCNKDLFKLLTEDEALSTATKAARKECFVVRLADGVLSYHAGSEAEELAKSVLGSTYVTQQTDFFKGLVANKGVVTGRVRILHANDMLGARQMRKTFEKGDILVTEMTQPNIMDIASRAGGLVTDEGGMLSHAAIISRELKIPCIVNTAVATKVLKDGDMVEVNGDTGAVSVITRAESV